MKFDVGFTITDKELDTAVDFDRNVTVTQDHGKLYNRDAEDSHPIGAITGLQQELDDKMESSNILTNMEIEELLK